MDQRKGYLNLRDMFDGGGMGRSGDKFEGGGLLSMLGNALGIAPLGSRQREEQLAALSQGAAGMAVNPPAPVQRTAPELTMDGAPGFRDSRRPSGAPIPVPGLDAFGGAGPNIPNAMPSFGAGSIDAFGGTGPMRYSGRGNIGMPVGNQNIPDQVGSMGIQMAPAGATALNQISQSGSGMIDTPGPAPKPKSILDMAVGGTEDQKAQVYNKFLMDLNQQFDASIIEDLQNTGGIWDLYQTYLQNNGSFY